MKYKKNIYLSFINLYYQLQNGIIVLSTKGAELYNRGLLTFDNNGQNIYNIQNRKQYVFCFFIYLHYY